MAKYLWAKFILGGIALAVLGIFSLSYLIYWGGSPRQESVDVNSDTPPELVLGNFHQVEGTGYYLAEILNDRPSSYLDYESARWSSFGTGGQTRNIVFLDGGTLESRKLFETNNSFILSIALFPEKPSKQGDQPEQEIVPVQWFVYYVVHQDSNQDELLNQKDRSVLAISDYNGLRYKEMLGGLLDIYELTMPEEGRLLVVYKLSEDRFASLIDMRTQEVILTQPLPELGTEVE